MTLNRRQFLTVAGVTTAAATIRPSAAVAANQVSIPFFSQRDSRWASKQCGSSGPKYTIGINDPPRTYAIGCAMTSVAMLLKYKGADVDPDKLNTWLTGHSGYANGSEIVWSKAADFDGMTRGLAWVGVGSLSTAADLKRQIDAGQLVIVKSKRFDLHWGVVVGYSGNGTSLSQFSYRDAWDSTAQDRAMNDANIVVGAVTKIFK